jgi:hypothetical protein
MKTPTMAAVGRTLLRAAFILLASLAFVGDASGQLYGRPVAQPYFDYPPFARWENCRSMPTAWGFDPFAISERDCDPVGCRQGFVAHRPSAWYVTADFLPLTYDLNHDVELARFGTAGPTALSTSDLDVEFDSGMRLTVGRTLGDCYQVEGVYQGNYSWDDVASVTRPAGTQDFSHLLNAFTTATGTEASTSVFSEMQTAEVNFRTWLDLPPGPFDVQLLVGARYMQIDEDFRFAIDSLASDVRVLTENELWGVQLGVDLKWLVHPRVFLDFDAKGAICHNDASVTAEFNTTDSAVGERTSFIGDLLLTANWQMTPSWSIRAGYQALFVNGIAIGPDNLQSNTAALQGGNAVQLNDRGEVVYHGPVLGVTWAR